MFPLDMNKIDVVHLPEGKQNSSPDCQTPVKLEPPCQTCGRRKNFLIEKGIVKTKLLEDILVLPILPATEIAKKVSRRIPGSRILTGTTIIKSVDLIGSVAFLYLAFLFMLFGYCVMIVLLLYI